MQIEERRIRSEGTQQGWIPRQGNRYQDKSKKKKKKGKMIEQEYKNKRELRDRAIEALFS